MVFSEAKLRRVLALARTEKRKASLCVKAEKIGVELQFYKSFVRIVGEEKYCSWPKMDTRLDRLKYLKKQEEADKKRVALIRLLAHKMSVGSGGALTQEDCVRMLNNACNEYGVVISERKIPK